MLLGGQPKINCIMIRNVINCIMIIQRYYTVIPRPNYLVKLTVGLTV